MACIVVVDRKESHFCFACNTVGQVFGPLCYVEESRDIEQVIEDFLEYLGKDPRLFTNAELSAKWYEFEGDSDE